MALSGLQPSIPPTPAPRARVHFSYSGKVTCTVSYCGSLCFQARTIFCHTNEAAFPPLNTSAGVEVGFKERRRARPCWEHGNPETVTLERWDQADFFILKKGNWTTKGMMRLPWVTMTTVQSPVNLWQQEMGTWGHFYPKGKRAAACSYTVTPGRHHPRPQRQEAV